MIVLVTAKHVILNDDGTQRQNLAYRLNSSGQPSVLIPDSLASKHAGPWFMADQDDVALRFIVFNPKADIKALGRDFFLKQEQIQPGAPVLIAGFPLGQRSEDHADPIVRRGIVARPAGQTILIDAFTFPGNSGGPVFYVPTIKVGKNLAAHFLNRDMLVGIVSKQILYIETTISQQTKRPRVIFEDNAGLTEVVPAGAIQKLLDRRDVTAFIKTKQPEWKETTGEP